MERTLTASLVRWREQQDHLPLLLRGARQVGKSYLAETFGKKAFQNTVVINFELRPDYKTCFTSLDPRQIVSRLALLSRTPIRPGETLLFLDEIQECPEALHALRYFKEQMPDLHVIAAGSLLEFLLNAPDFRMPVGRIQSLYLKPFSFYEYLDATGHRVWREHLNQVTLSEGVDEGLHTQLLQCLKEYFLLGGMPAVIRSWLKNHDYHQCQKLQAGILDAYRSDFGKYAKHTDYNNLQMIFAKAPGLACETLKYSSISQNVPSRDLKRALNLLIHAGVITPVYYTHAAGLPLNAGQVESRFKLIFLDVGLSQYTSHLSADILMADDIMLLNRGKLAEQFVGQELLSIIPAYNRPELFYWYRDKPGSTAEVDYVTHVGSQIMPVEVKAGKTGRLKSIQIFLTEKKLSQGIRISTRPLGFERSILSVPLYMIPEIRRLTGNIQDPGGVICP